VEGDAGYSKQSAFGFRRLLMGGAPFMKHGKYKTVTNTRRGGLSLASIKIKREDKQSFLDPSGFQLATLLVMVKK